MQITQLVTSNIIDNDSLGNMTDDRSLTPYEFSNFYGGQLLTSPLEHFDLYGLRCDRTCSIQQKDTCNSTECTKFVDAANVPGDMPCAQWMECVMCSCYPNHFPGQVSEYPSAELPPPPKSK